jgi:hypothetical protein
MMHNCNGEMATPRVAPSVGNWRVGIFVALAAIRVRVVSPSNVLEIVATPWRPCDYQKVRDDRTLGIFLRRVDVLPEEGVPTAENP